MIQTTVGELLQIAMTKDKTPKVQTVFEDGVGATCFNGGIAQALGLGPTEGGNRVVSALNKVKLQVDRIPRSLRTAIIGGTKGKLGLGNVSVYANDETTLKKKTIAKKLLETLTPEELAQPVKIVEPRRRTKLA